ncbi:MAG: type II toxin-antitoxin system HicB family antitoxin [bacterium]|nr:type II toxin-antitoxin system HicB family antitoxin [bacterium]
MASIKSRLSHLQYNVVLRPEPEGGFTVIVPALPGCVTYGRDLSEAKKMAIDAIEGYLASLEKHHEPIPSEDKSLITSVRIKRLPLKKKNLIHA